MHSTNSSTMSPMKRATSGNPQCLVNAFLNQDIMYLYQLEVTMC